MTATEYQLQLIDWQFFGTATWRESRLGSCRSREADLWDFLKWFTAFKTDLEFRQVPIVVRWEKGETGDRPHAHWLVGGLIHAFVNIGACFAAMHEWHERAGLARLRQFGRHRAPKTFSAYLMFGIDGGGDVYELNKFGYADRLVISDAAWRRMLSACTDAPYVAQLPTL